MLRRKFKVLGLGAALLSLCAMAALNLKVALREQGQRHVQTSRLRSDAAEAPAPQVAVANTAILQNTSHGTTRTTAGSAGPRRVAMVCGQDYVAGDDWVWSNCPAAYPVCNGHVRIVPPAVNVTLQP